MPQVNGTGWVPQSETEAASRGSHLSRVLDTWISVMFEWVQTEPHPSRGLPKLSLGLSSGS